MSQNSILEKINSSDITVGVIGLGYVGLPLAVTFSLKGVNVIGFDVSQTIVDEINNSQTRIDDVNQDELKKVISTYTFRATTVFEDIRKCDAIIICVPTPLDRFKKPDMSYIESATISIAQNMKKGTFICLESTTYPTTTENLVLPLIEEHSGLKINEDFWLAFSPERVDPGNARFKTNNTPKVLGAIGEESLQIGKSIYEIAIENIHTVSSPKVAEMVKILENTYRLVNISLINELAMLANRMNIDIWEVIEAAKTKPYGFQAFYPSPGIGGHCIPLDPFYLEYIAKGYNFDLSMINTAGQINNKMPHMMLVRINFALNKHKKAVNGSRILFIGIAYKPNINDARESPALKIIDEVIRKGGDVSYFDPFISNSKTDEGHYFESVELSEDILRNADCVVLTSKHDNIDYDLIYENSKLIVDMQNIFESEPNKVIKL